MNTVTHALTMNGRIHSELKDRADTPETVIRQRLSLLDGNRRFSLGLWAIPGGVTFDDVDLAQWPKEYIQVAGAQERMTIEVRKLEADQPRQYIIGHHARTYEEDRQSEIIHWNGCEATVLPSEVFNAAEAADIFMFYYATGSVPKSCTLRLL